MSQTKPNPVVTVGKVVFGNSKPLSLIAGPCPIERREHALKEITTRLGVGFVKSSYDKANRTSVNGPEASACKR